MTTCHFPQFTARYPTYCHILEIIFLSQVVYVATYAYFILALVGYQELSSEPDLFFPFFLVLKFIFFIGWLKVSVGISGFYVFHEYNKVASAINHPFGDDEDDFQIGELISRHVWVRKSFLRLLKGSISQSGHRQDPVPVQGSPDAP